MERLLRNKGFVARGINGYIGKINIEGVTLDINATFWKREKRRFVWIQRQKMIKYDEREKKFYDIMPRPILDCKANYTYKKFPDISYRGQFMFARFKFDLTGRFEDKKEKILLFDISKSEEQPLIETTN